MTIGVLYKYVNALQGWRPRLVVLDPITARLYYYHMAGPTAVRVARVEESLRQRYGEMCEISFVGVQVGVIRKKELGLRLESFGFGSGRARDVRDQAHPEELLRVKVVELKRIRESDQDDRKIWVNETLELKAESQDDRHVWAKAMRDVMVDGELGMYHQRMYELGRDNVGGGCVDEVDGVELRREAEASLERMGASDEVKSYVFGIVASLAKECEKRRTMLDIVYRLEDEKRELETRLAVEGAMAGEGQDADQYADMDGSESMVADGSEEGDEMMERMRERGEDGEYEEEFFDAEEGKWDVAGRSSSLGELARFDATCVLLDGGRPGLGVSASSSASIKPTASTISSSPSPGGVTNKPPLSSSPLSAPTRDRRQRLPKPQQQEKAISLWSLIKEMVGKDLTRVCLPVYFNEPLSALELTAEDLEYSELLDIAASHPAGSMERIVNIMAFAISPYSSTDGRTSKPFNPLLGETYELLDDDKGFRFVAEKVSHHPTIIAAHAVGGWRRGGNNKWTYQGDAEIKSRFWGRSIELKPEGVLRLDFEDGDSYSWHKVTTRINNLIIGKIYVDHGGVMKIRRHGDAPSTVAKVFFHETKMLFDRDPRRIEGHVEIDGVPMPYPQVEGHWNEEISVTWAEGRCERVWTKNPMPEPENRNRYNLTRYAIGLNEITPEMEGRLAPTDSRLRPDQRLTELGMWEEANAEKQRLEHKQRAARKAAEEGVPLKPRWFTINQEQIRLNGSTRGHHVSSKELCFVFTGEYWRARAQGEFEGVRDIFG